MTFFRRTTQLAVIVAAFAVGLFVFFESTGVVGSQWRRELADGLEAIFDPGLDDWQLAILGAALALAAVMLIAAQLAPTPQGRSRMLEVSNHDDGTTRIAGRATLRAVEHELRQIEGVTDASATMPTRRKVLASIRVDDRCSLEDIEREARTALDTPFWIALGVPDIAVDLTVEFDPRPPRVR